MTYCSQKDRYLIAQYRFINRLPWTIIITKVHGAILNQVHKLCTYLKTKHPNTSSDELVDITGRKKKQGNKT